MRLHRTAAILWQELFVTIHSTEVVVDIFFYPLVNVVVFGFVAEYLSGAGENSPSGTAGQFLLQGMLLWQVIWIVQYSVTLGSLWNVWSRNLSNMFVAPLMVKEYLFAQMLSGVVKAIGILAAGWAVARLFFGFDLLAMGWGALALTFANFVLFAFATGIAVIGLIFRYGTRIQALAWGLIAIFQPLSAAYFPLAVLPTGLRMLAYAFPPTFAFEAAREGLTLAQAIDWRLFGLSLAENIVYLVLCAALFRYLFRKSRDSGQFARNEA